MLIAVGGVACSSPSDDALNQSVGPLQSPTTTTSAALPSTTAPAPATCDPRASLRPEGNSVPAPSDFATYPTVARIQQRGKLVVGVDEGTQQLGLPRPEDGDDRRPRRRPPDARSPTRSSATTSPPQHLKFKTLTTAERIDAVADGKVDMVASLLTATCERWQKVDFSTEYYEAHQDVLVPIDSDIHSVDRPRGQDRLRDERIDLDHADPREGPDRES